MRVIIFVVGLSILTACGIAEKANDIGGVWYLEDNARVPLLIKDEGDTVEITRCLFYATSIYDRKKEKLVNRHFFEEINIISDTQLELVNHSESGEIKKHIYKYSDDKRFAFGEVNVSSDMTRWSTTRDVCAYSTGSAKEGNHKAIIITAPFESSYLSMTVFVNNYEEGEYDVSARDGVITQLSPEFESIFRTTVLNSHSGVLTLSIADEERMVGEFTIGINESEHEFVGTFNVTFLE